MLMKNLPVAGKEPRMRGPKRTELALSYGQKLIPQLHGPPSSTHSIGQNTPKVYFCTGRQLQLNQILLSSYLKNKSQKQDLRGSNESQNNLIALQTKIFNTQ